jgi:hypothetical protein
VHLVRVRVVAGSGGADEAVQDERGDGVMNEPVEQVFLESGTWVKPPGATWVFVELKSGEGGAASDGTPGGQGWLVAGLTRASELPDEVPVKVGRAGRPRRGAASGDGWARVTTYFTEVAPRELADGKRG